MAQESIQEVLNEIKNGVRNVTIVASENWFNIDDDNTVGVRLCVDNELLPDKDSVVKAMRNAATTYCRTQDGYDTFCHNGQVFDFGDFVLNVPQDILNRYGIISVEADKDLIACDYNEALVYEQRVYDANMGPLLTKEDLKARLMTRESLSNIYQFTPGQECEIVKASKWIPGDLVIYIPDASVQDIPINRPIHDDGLEDVLSHCYTGNDFVEICEGDVEKAKKLSSYVDWQTPSAAYDAGEIDDD